MHSFIMPKTYFVFSTDIGPLISKQSKERVLRLIDSAKKEGAKVLLDGSNVKVTGFESGNFVGPTIIADVKPNMTCYKVIILYLFDPYLGGNLWACARNACS